jgi:hypothetical protein
MATIAIATTAVAPSNVASEYWVLGMDVTAHGRRINNRSHQRTNAYIAVDRLLKVAAHPRIRNAKPGTIR